MDTRPVLVVTGVDRTADAVIAALYNRGVPVIRFDLADFAVDTSLTASLGEDGLFHGVLRTPSRCVDVTEVRSVYYRRPTYPELLGMPADDRTFVEDQIRYGFHGVLQTLPRCLYVNHPRSVAAAEWKPAQLQAAGQLGFNVPATIITNDLREATAFARDRGPVVYKTVSWCPYKIKGEPRTVWVRDVDPAELDESVAGTAHLFQSRVEKVADVRVTVVGESIFCAKITSPLVDWRENYDLIEDYTVIEPPPEICTLLRGYLRRWGLVYGCFDLGVDRSGDWWFYECNPAGEWGWIEEYTAMPIAQAFAEVLERGVNARLVET